MTKICANISTHLFNENIIKYFLQLIKKLETKNLANRKRKNEKTVVNEAIKVPVFGDVHLNPILSMRQLNVFGITYFNQFEDDYDSRFSPMNAAFS